MKKIWHIYIWYDNIEYKITIYFDAKIYHGKNPIFNHRNTFLKNYDFLIDLHNTE